MRLWKRRWHDHTSKHLAILFFPDPFLKAAALAHAIAHDPPFVDGNKRTALLASMILLEQHGWTFPIREHYEDGYERVQALAVNDGFEAYACWLRKYAQCTGAG
ncbi:MAG TPA: Fic family protein [Armatimonadota bacterium]|nr:Fic family protein [Armatimonadota bacterium]